MKLLVCCLFCACAAPPAIHAQAIENLHSFDRPVTDRAVQFAYENDFFAATDHYYTQGVSLMIASPALRHNPVNFILLKPRSFQRTYLLGAEHNAYTASYITHDELLPNDYPFSAELMLKSMLLASDSAKGILLSSSLSAGLLGPGAGGYEIQYGIHSRTGNILPKGWQHQLRNAPILNYEAGYERRLLQVPRHFLLAANASARLGTLSIRGGLGLTAMAGIFKDPFTHFTQSRARQGFQLFGYIHPEVFAIGYNAVLQGGIFTNNEYVVPPAAIRRIYFQNRMGLCLRYRRTSLYYFRDYYSREFETATVHGSGGLSISVSF